MDFHTSEAIAGVGADFDPDAFAETLADARVNSVTCCARCHHGWMYFDSKRFPERVHPHLARRRLLEEQIEACHKRDIRVPVYTTVGWDHYTASRRPDWCQITPDGRIHGTPPLEAGFYRRLCLNTPYADFLREHVRELLETLPVDGLFFDIVLVNECLCRRCVEGMCKAGMNPESKEDRIVFAKQLNVRFRLGMTELVHRHSKECTVFYNRGHVGPSDRDSKAAFTHYELESLPSGGWGYAHFPLTVRYARTLGLDCLGMTGKFHTSWGDFHSYKNQPALEFECMHMLAQNAKCSVGDQLHPSGRIDPYAYELIGSVYGQVQEKEPWCVGASAVTDIGLVNVEEFTGESVAPSAVGAVRMLQESAHQFDVLDTRSDFTPYKVLILPDRVTADNALAVRLEQYVASGGKLIASFESGMNPEKTEFAVKSLGVTLRANPTMTPAGKLSRSEPLRGTNDYTEYILPRGFLAKGLRGTEYATYAKGVEIESSGAEVLAETVASYFNRSWRHFCSHRQTPSSRKVDYPAVMRNGPVIYFAHPIFAVYSSRAPLWCKIMLQNALDMLLPDPLLRHGGPSTIIATVNEQASQQRWIIHLLHYIPERRGTEFDTIEDIIPVYNLPVSVKTNEPVRSVRGVPQGDALPFASNAARTEFILPELRGHQMIELSF